ncbi:MAG: metallophosphoesterase [Alistipes sp.]|nr:metallophosphoesterase [Candidatus Minthomonas equi]
MKKALSIFLFAILATFNAYSVDIIHGPYLQNLTENRVTIVWVTDSVTVGWVELAPDDKSVFYDDPRPRYYDAPTGVKESSTIHAVTIDGLQPNTTYRYRVYATHVTGHVGNYVTYGKTTASSPYNLLTFHTVNPDAASISFGIVNDIHGDNETFTSLIGKCDLKKTDFFIFNGDMISVSETQEQVFEGFMDTAVKLFAQTIPMYYSRGNHETRGAMATQFKKYFSPGEDHIYYTFRQGPVFFVVLDGGEDKPDTDIEYYGITDYDAYRTKEAEWLSEVVSSAEYRNAPFKVVLCHMPPEKNWHGSYEILQKFVPILNGAKPDLFISGHEHSYHWYEPNGKTHFPVLINDTESIVKVTADKSSLDISIVNTEGKTKDTHKITR